MTPIFHGFVKDGKLTLSARQSLRNYMHTLSGPVDITIKKHRKQRSENQNRYYWGVVVSILANEIGYTSDEMHDALKFKFLQKPEADERIPTIQSSARLSTHEFEDYIEKIRRWSAIDMGIYIPDPGQIDV